jgi:hypothetical protein
MDELIEIIVASLVLPKSAEMVSIKTVMDQTLPVLPKPCEPVPHPAAGPIQTPAVTPTTNASSMYPLAGSYVVRLHLRVLVAVHQPGVAERMYILHNTSAPHEA